MKRALIIIGIIVLAIVGLVLISPKSDDSKSTSNKFATIQQDVKNGAKLIDVRTPEEYSAGHFENAINFDSTKVEAGQLPDIAKNTKIYLYCHSGRRAGIVLTALKNAGFTDVTSLGGIENVESIGGKITKS